MLINGSGSELAQFKQKAIPPGPLSFLLIARLLDDKLVREDAESAQRMRVRYPEVRCALVEWVDMNPDAICVSQLDQWVQEGTVEYPGRLQDVHPAINACSVYVLPS